MGQSWPDGYSATVEAYLIVGDARFPVAQVAGNALILREPQDIGAGTEAKLVITIDGDESVQQIVLGHGASERQQFVSFS